MGVFFDNNILGIAIYSDIRNICSRKHFSNLFKSMTISVRLKHRKNSGLRLDRLKIF